MKKVIVTGANGFIGSNLVKKLLSENITVIAVVHNANSSNLPKNDNLITISCDSERITDLLDMIPLNSCDTFYHFAWTGSAGPLRTDYKLHLRCAEYLLDTMKVAEKLGIKRFIVAGTMMEHEIISATYTPGVKPNPAYIYSAGKTVAHLMASALATSLSLDLIWTKITNTYGPGEESPRLINTTIRKCIAGIVPEFTSATQNYDFIYIDDLVDAYYLIGVHGKPLRTYVIGSSEPKPLRNFLDEMQETIAPKIKFKYGAVPYNGVNLPLELFDCSQLELDTGFKAKVSFAEGCKRTMEWWLKNSEQARSE